jgi:hypothetical protein
MPTNQDYVSADISQKAVRLEEKLSLAIQQVADEIAHTECLDEEQRAEVYTILDTLRSDTRSHQGVVGRWVSDRLTGTQNA